MPLYFNQKELDQLYVKFRLFDMSGSLVKPPLKKEDIGAKRRVPMIPAGFKWLLSFKIPVREMIREV